MINTTTKDLPTWHLNTTVTMADVMGLKPVDPPLYRLHDYRGDYLHKSGLSLTLINADAWIGSEDEMRSMTAIPHLKPARVYRR